jgi:DNA-directed RNA polymerase sigma subunit (sigma70/sigma32)
MTEDSYTLEGPIMRADAARAFLSVLSCTNADIIARIYGLRGYYPQLECEIAETYGITPARINQRKQKALEQMYAKAAKILLPQ